MKIRKVTLVNFQTHTRKTLKLSRTITTIKGPTDRGKSSIVRALQWATLNVGSGDGFVKEGEDGTEVSVEIVHKKERHTVERVRRQGRRKNNLYKLDGQEYKAFGSSVPSDISNLLSLAPVNFQSQHDAPFWFSISPAEVSRQLNAVIDLSVIDDTLQNVAAEVRKAQERVSVTEERLQDARSKLKAAKQHKARIREFYQLQDKQKEAQKATQTWEVLRELIQRLEANDARTLRRKAEAGDEVLKYARKLKDLRARVQSLTELLEDLLVFKKRAVPPPDFSLVQRTHARWQESQEKLERLERLLSNVNRYNTQASECKACAKEAEQKFHRITKNKICPLCGNRMQ